MELTVCKKMCNECPFRTNSPNGWLGSHTIEEIQNSIQFEGLFSCHKQRGDDQYENEQKILSGEHNICRGFMLSAKKSCKVFGQNPNTRAELRRLQEELNPTEEELENTLSKWDFAKHHTL